VAPDALHDELAATMGSRAEARWLLEDLGGPDVAPRATRARALAARRAAGEPLQYVLGHWPFRGLDLLVDARALIPRPETEVLVGLAVPRVVASGDGAIACDLGCGTGAIALSLSAEVRAAGREVAVHATEVDDDALALARLNAARVGAVGVSFRHGSWFDALPASLRGRVDVCCSNPPYVAVAERRALARELDFEPELALVADDGADGTPGFGAVEAVVTGAREWLAPGGTLLVEHAATHRDAATSLATRCGLVVVADHDDLAGRPRVLEARSPR
jgi:release factor glutamine methyltransferase